MLILMNFAYFYSSYTHQNVWVPKRKHSKIFSVRCNYSVPCSVKHVVVLMHAANATLDRSGDLQSGITTDYSEKPSSMVTT